MRPLLLLTLAFGLLMSLSAPVLAADDVQAIVDKAIKAHGGAEKLDKNKATKSKSKGKININGMEIDVVSQELTAQLPGKIKQEMELDFMGMKIKVVTVFDGENGWINTNGTTVDAPDVVLAEFKEAGNMMRASQLTSLKDGKKFQLAPLGEVKVNDKPAVGIKVSSKGFRDISMYFYKDSGLIAKIERRTVDNSGKEVNEERITLEYTDADGMKAPKKMLVNHDGKKFIEGETSEVKHLEKVDDSEFAKP